ncbi:TetR/AcrR family transcriptional regulator [Hespellia stercorisuis]|uniref:Transcriptional regulator, TetR family n=1 Tax=Hespellia stercorisuis DSM 15480 TaxID=1121950 RepID=A0A1M6MKP8_9FIRM|nr:TetR/AcrR family transcriptional regulator [Hespellia stercorisuis]SHJ84032.1 transcriptional regulator, TetR family [Hespellia stercorisuis DSM 15480]
MPKCYSEQEREYIKNRLREEAAKCLGQYGIRRTTVDELVKRVKIPKGTFYLFYQSKELLLFEVILKFHDQIETELYQAFAQICEENFHAEKVTDIIFGFFKKASESPILRMLDSDEVQLLARKLPPEVLQNHLEYDEDMVERVFSLLPVRTDVDQEVFSAAFRGIYFATLHRDEMGAEHFDEALRLLVNGLVLQMMQ